MHNKQANMKEASESQRIDSESGKAIASLVQENKELRAMLDTLKKIPLSEAFESSARAIFDICKALTQATCGYVALLSDNGTENEVLFLDDGGLPCTVDPSLPMPIRGLRETAYKSRQVAYDNDFDNSEWCQFMPPGHVKLNNVLFAPLNFADKTVGVIGLANKPEGFNHNDLEIAGTFGEIAALALKHSRIQESLVERNKFSANLLMESPNPILVIEPDKTIRYVNQAFMELTGFARDEILNAAPPYPWWTEDTILKTKSDLNRAMKRGANKIEEKFRKKNGQIFYVEITSVPVFDNGKMSYYLANWVDITEKKEKEKELIKKQEELESHTKKLEEMNTALKVLIDYRGEEIDGFKRNIAKKIERIVIPYFPTSPESKTREELSTTISILENNIKEILSNGELMGKDFSDLSPTESHVAFMVKSGKSSKEIADSLNMSLRTVYFHRENLRKKLKLSKKTNLKAYLQSTDT